MYTQIDLHSGSAFRLRSPYVYLNVSQTVRNSTYIQLKNSFVSIRHLEKFNGIKIFKIIDNILNIQTYTDTIQHNEQHLL